MWTGSTGMLPTLEDDALKWLAGSTPTGVSTLANGAGAGKGSSEGQGAPMREEVEVLVKLDDSGIDAIASASPEPSRRYLSRCSVAIYFKIATEIESETVAGAFFISIRSPSRGENVHRDARLAREMRGLTSMAWDDNMNARAATVTVY